MVPDSTGNMWVDDSVLNRVAKFSPAGVLLATYNVPTGNTRPLFEAFDGTNVWVTMFGATATDNLKVIGPLGTQIASYSTAASGSNDYGCIVFDGANMWTQLDNSANGKISKVRASDGSILATYTPPANKGPYSDCRSIAFDGTHIWFSDQLANLWQISTNATLVNEFPYGIYPDPNITGVMLGPIYAGGLLWVNDGQSFVLSINPATGALNQLIPLGSNLNPVSMASDGTNLWVCNDHDGSITIISLTSGIIVGNYKTGNSANNWNQITYNPITGDMWASTNSALLYRMTLYTPPPAIIIPQTQQRFIPLPFCMKKC